MEKACGHTEECIAGLRMMVEASGGSHAFIRGYQTLLAAVDVDNASQVSKWSTLCVCVCVRVLVHV